MKMANVRHPRHALDEPDRQIAAVKRAGRIRPSEPFAPASH
jgi:hypothetical protein